MENSVVLKVQLTSTVELLFNTSLGKIVVCGFALALALCFALYFCPVIFALALYFALLLSSCKLSETAALACLKSRAFSGTPSRKTSKGILEA